MPINIDHWPIILYSLHVISYGCKNRRINIAITVHVTFSAGNFYFYTIKSEERLKIFLIGIVPYYGLERCIFEKYMKSVSCKTTGTKQHIPVSMVAGHFIGSVGFLSGIFSPDRDDF